MRIESLQTINQLIGQDNNKDQKTVFGDFFDAAMNRVNETNALEKEANDITLDFILGETDNIHDVMIAQEKANVALQYTVEIRNKTLDAYNELMRMQI
ncbi:flagellar hook-basal body complex protein FliE [Natranaerovirga hydrolytica]|uniref:Flagellar hook-basal body complex protein FliE n=1 Tax=Natranaerovirga hydrolytica TaxID=680378 RepID=A0A4R1MXF4_9FIRM|nr:flagellar hook-basal body complex protein FliE [Natranaerovirga hydrolytica]TCK97886.1 flagellar hook-basal body complex protein FliE [Natranaerovirga hydrolytica]